MKMSKSLGNVVNPEDITKGGKDLNKHPVYGVDVLRYSDKMTTIRLCLDSILIEQFFWTFFYCGRWWVASHATQHTLVPMKSTLLQGSAETVGKLRLVFRFLLGVLHTYDRSKSTTVEPQYHHLDRYILHQLYHYHQEVSQFLNIYRLLAGCRTEDFNTFTYYSTITFLFLRFNRCMIPTSTTTSVKPSSISSQTTYRPFTVTW